MQVNQWNGKKKQHTTILQPVTKKSNQSMALPHREHLIVEQKERYFIFLKPFMVYPEEQLSFRNAH